MPEAGKSEWGMHAVVGISIVVLTVILGALLKIVSDVSALQTQVRQIEPSAHEAQAFAQLSSIRTQRPANIRKTLIQMESRDEALGIEFDPRQSTTDIHIVSDGVYFLIAAPQISRRAAGVKQSMLDMWIVLNGQDLANSSVRYAFAPTTIQGTQLRSGDNPTDVLVLQAALSLKAGDVLQLAMAVSAVGQGIGLYAIRPDVGPTVPAIITSLVKVS